MVKFDIKESLNQALHSSILILKLVVPIYILADMLIYLGWLKYISFIFEPVTNFLHLPLEATLAIISGIFLNLYAAIAFAAPLGLTPQEWTILGLFLGVCHSLVIESAIMKKLGMTYIYSIFLRVSMAFLAVIPLFFMPDSWFGKGVKTAKEVKKSYDSFSSLLFGSFEGSLVLSFKIIVLIVSIIFLMDFLKSTKFFSSYQKRVSSAFSIVAGLILGITYGAGVLIKEAKSGDLSKSEILYIGTFLMICHSIIEDTLLFVIFGANMWVMVSIRVVYAIVIGYLVLKIYKNTKVSEINPL